MRDIQKIFLLLVMTAILCVMLYQSALDGQCMKYHADGAKWTASGVYCWRQGVFREYYLLEELRVEHDGPLLEPPFIQPTSSGFGA